jgi:hypothetical protein
VRVSSARTLVAMMGCVCIVSRWRACREFCHAERMTFLTVPRRLHHVLIAACDRARCPLSGMHT